MNKTCRESGWSCIVAADVTKEELGTEIGISQSVDRQRKVNDDKRTSHWDKTNGRSVSVYTLRPFYLETDD